MTHHIRPAVKTGLVATVLATAIVAGCGGSPELTASVDTMIEFEAKWQCDVTRFSFASTDEIDAKRDETRARYGVSAEDHKIFTDMVEDDPALRDAVATLTDETCPVTES